MSAKTSKKFDESSTWNSVLDQLAKANYDAAYKKLDELIEKVDNPFGYLYVKAVTLYGQQKALEALEAVNRALHINPNWSQNYKLKAEILYNYPQNAEDMQQALAAIDTAISLYNTEQTDDQEEFVDMAAFKQWLEGRIATRSDMSNLKTSIDATLKMLTIQTRVEQMEGNLANERTRSIEALGLFTAVIAVIFANVNAAGNLRGVDFLWLNLGLVLPISFLVVLIRPDGNARNKGLLIIILIALAGGIAGYLLRGA